MLGARTTGLSFVAILSLAACSGTTSATGSGGTGAGGGSTTTTTTTQSGTGGAGTGGAGTGGTGTGGQPTPGQPITTPSEQWTWVDFPDAFCANGSPTGIGVNLTTKSSRVLIYLEGGGACWDQLTCYSLMTAANFASGYGATQFASDKSTQLSEAGGFFDRTAAANPFKDYSYVYVPYCTGDIHAGDNVATYGSNKAHHVGFANMTAYLRRLVPTFPSAERVYIAGSSAGGFGAAYNWWQAQQAFGSIRVDLIDDSGTPMPKDIPTQYLSQEVASWGLASTLPPGCTNCLTDLSQLMAFYGQKFPDHRATLLSYVQDSTLPTYFGIMPADFSKGLSELLAAYFKPGSGFQAFTNPGSGHVLWFSPLLTTTTASGPVTVQEFLTKMVTDDPSWATVQ